MRDFRGFTYQPAELGKPCRCGDPAVRNYCAAESDADRTHRHGEVHLLAGGSAALCAACGHAENAKWEAMTKGDKITKDQRKAKMREIVAYELRRGLDNIEQRIATAIDEEVIQPALEQAQA